MVIYAMKTGWIKIYRGMLQWEWFSDAKMVQLFLYLLLSANVKELTFKGAKIKRGQLVTGLKKISSETGLSIQSVRTCLKRLKKTGEINMRSNNQFSVVTICNYEFFQNDIQEDNKQPNIRLTSNQQATNKQLTTSKEVRSNKKEKIYKKENGHKTFGKFQNVKLLPKEFDKLSEKFGKSTAENKIETLSEYLASSGKKYKSHYATILCWARKDTPNPKQGDEWI